MGNRAAPAYTGPPVTAPPRAPAGYYSRSGQPRRAPAYRPAPAVGAYRQPRARYATAPTYAAPAGKSYDLFSLYFLFLLQLSPGHQWLMLQLMQLQVFKTLIFFGCFTFFYSRRKPYNVRSPDVHSPCHLRNCSNLCCTCHNFFDMLPNTHSCTNLRHLICRLFLIKFQNLIFSLQLLLQRTPLRCLQPHSHLMRLQQPLTLPQPPPTPLQRLLRLMQLQQLTPATPQLPQ